MSNKFLSKSLYVRGLQCPKSLWLKKYKSDVLEQNTDPNIFETVNIVGELACELFSGGKRIDFDGSSFNDKIDQTKKFIKDGEKFEISLDLKPALEEKQLDLRIQKDFKKNLNKDFKNSLDELLPKKLIPVIIELSKIDENKKVNSITKEERRTLLNLLKNLTFTVKGLRDISEAIVTAGGLLSLLL